jgi:glucose/arabinose dehydrogenase/PKD repeat protein
MLLTWIKSLIAVACSPVHPRAWLCLGLLAILTGCSDAAPGSGQEDRELTRLYLSSPGLTAGYAFDEGTGTATADASGNNLNGTLTSGATWGPGRNRTALRLDGVNDYVNLTNPTALRITGSLTISAWVNASTDPGNDTAIVSKRNTAGYQLDLTEDRGPRTIGFKLTSSSGGDMIRYGSSGLALNTWYHVAGVYDATARTMNVYLNGQLNNGAVVGTVAAAQQNSSANVNIGRRASGGYPFGGSVDDVRIYARALSVSEIVADMNAGAGAPPPAPDTTPPAVSVTAPAEGAALTGSVNVAATATDNTAVSGVQFLLDGANLGAEDTSAPYSVPWNTATASNGAHSVTARARDAAGNTTTSAAVAVTVANPPTLTITSPAESATVAGTTVNIAYSAAGDLTAVDHVHFQLDGGAVLMDMTLDGVFQLTGVPAGPHTLTGVLVRADHTNIAGSEDVVNFSTTSGDTTPPTVSMTAPAANANVSGTITLSANASDTVGVAGVQFLVDGNAVGQEDLTSPYSISWDSRGVSNGSHTVSARARDAAGNSATSSARTITVQNTGGSEFFQNEILLTGLNLPTVIKFLPDGKMLIGELGGRIVILRPGASAIDPTPFLQLTNVGTLNSQQGVMDIVLDPNFTTNGHYYVFYTLGMPNRDRVSRLTATGLTTALSSEFVIWQDEDDANDEHHGGALNFGNDGKLYITTGEHFEPPFAQRMDSYRGKVLRYNSDGTIPTDNPFHDGAGPNKDAIWALGLRNPFRAFYDRQTGNFYVGDVGGNVFSTAVEEVNLVTRGANFGWPNCEGTCNDPRYVDPVYSYTHNGRDAAVVSGFVYRGTQFPSAYYGSYFFGDYAQNWIKRATLDTNGRPNAVFNFEPPNGALDGPTGDIVYLTEGPEGALYYIDLGWSDVTGAETISKIRRISYIQSNQPPVVVSSATPLNGPAPLSVQFSSGGSSDPEGAPLTYSWSFGDNTTSTEANPAHVYSATGRYTARLTVSDGVNSRLGDPINIDVGSRPFAAILAPQNGAFFRAGDVIAFSGDAVDDEDGTLPASAFSWQTLFRHSSHVHPGVPVPGSKTGSLVIPTNGHDYSGDTRYEISLTVTDSHGLQDTKSVTVYPDKVNVGFTTVPPGLTIVIDGIPRVTPFVHDTLIGFQHVIEAPTQTFGSSTYTFNSWSDGGTSQHTITVPAASQNLIASFTESAPALPPGLAAAYNFNEGSGTTAADRSGNNNTATLVGGATFGAGMYGSALLLDGTNDYFTVPNSTSLDISGTAFTLALWINPQPIEENDSVVLGKFWNASGMTPPYYQYGLELGDGDEPHFYFGTSSGGLLAAEMSTTLAFGQWTHLAITFDGASVRFYRNGTLVTTRAASGSLVARGNPLRVGADNRPQQFQKGMIDELRIYRRTLSLAEVQTDKNTAF